LFCDRQSRWRIRLAEASTGWGESMIKGISHIEELEKLAALRDQGIIADEEF
jgi:hypothetical protein